MPKPELLLEIVPPTRREGRAGLERCLALIDAVARQVPVAAINIPEVREESGRSDNGERLRPFEPRLPPRDFALRIAETCGIESVVNHVVAHTPSDELCRWLDDSIHRFGVRRFVLVGGEHSHVDYPGPAVTEANTLVRERFGAEDLRIGNICIPSRKGEARRVAAKRAAGADFFSTQILYRTEPALDLLDNIDPGQAVDFYFSFCPVRNERNIRFLHWLGVDIPESLEQWLLEDSDRTLERSKSRILDCWGRLAEQLRQADIPVRPHINLSPIGKIPLEETIELARGLLD